MGINMVIDVLIMVIDILYLIVFVNNYHTVPSFIINPENSLDYETITIPVMHTKQSVKRLCSGGIRLMR